MKSNYCTYLALILTLIFNNFCYALSSPTDDSYKVINKTLKSNVLSETRSVTIQLPKNYDSNLEREYPVFFRLDGASHLSSMNVVLESLQSQAAAPEVIIVAIENTDRLRDLYPTVNSDPHGPVGLGGGAEKFLQFITDELMPWLNDNFRTHHYNIIEGASAAGVFALYAMQQKPMHFNAAITYSPAVWWNFGATGKSTIDYFKSTGHATQYLYTAIGNEPEPMRGYYDQMISGIKKHKPQGLRWINDSFSDVPHNLTSSAGIFRAYHNLFYSQHMTTQDYTGNVSSIDEYYKKVSMQYGEQIVAPEWVIRQLAYPLVDKKQYQGAITLFEYGIQQYPNLPDPYNGLAYGFEQAGQFKKALEAVNQALALATKESPGYQVYYDRQQRLLKRLGQKPKR